MATVSDDDFKQLTEDLDQFYLIVMGMIVLLMQCGFAFLEAGSVRSKNSTNILIKNLLDSFVAGVAYWVFGFAFAFGSGNKFIGYEFFASAWLPDTSFAFFFFQYVFAATAATIVSGALAERCEFVAYFIYSFFITGFIYPVVTHWAWSDQAWLTAGMDYTIGNQTVNVGYQDFAGSGVVHVVGGVAGLMGAIIIGPRIGRFHAETKTAVDLRGHSVPFAALGGFILIFGFLAFNGGSTLSISSPGSGATTAVSVVNTVISGSVSAFFTLLLQKTGVFGNQRWSLLSTLNGALTGMVAACAGCNVYHPWGAAIVGFISSIAYKLTSWLMVTLRLDDPLDAVAVHFGGGTWGVIAVAFLDSDTGILFNFDKASGLKLAWQLCGFAAISVWSGTLSLIMFGGLRLMGKLRVSEEIERKGLDIPKHGEPAYPLESYGHGHIERIMKILESGQLQLITQGYVSEENADNTSEDGTLRAVHNKAYENPEEEMLHNAKTLSPTRNGSPSSPDVVDTKM